MYATFTSFTFLFFLGGSRSSVEEVKFVPSRNALNCAGICSVPYSKLKIPAGQQGALTVGGQLYA